jgi:predicted DNA-binding transcriptional regulator AlpA
MEAKVPARYLNEVQVANLTGRALSTLRNERARGLGIPYIKIGRSVRYDLADVIRFMESHKIMTQSVLDQDGSALGP